MAMEISFMANPFAIALAGAELRSAWTGETPVPTRAWTGEAPVPTRANHGSAEILPIAYDWEKRFLFVGAVWLRRKRQTESKY